MKSSNNSKLSKKQGSKSSSTSSATSSPASKRGRQTLSGSTGSSMSMTSSASSLSSSQSSASEQIILSDFSQLLSGDIRRLMINRLLNELHTNRESAQVELENAFDYAINRVLDGDYQDENEKLVVFLNVLSDFLHVTEDSIKNYLELCNIGFIEVSRQDESKSQVINDDTHASNQYESQPEIKSSACIVVTKENGEMMIVEKGAHGEGYLVSNDEKRRKISRQNMNHLTPDALRQRGAEVKPLISYINEMLPYYHLSTNITKNNVFGNPTISCYPAELYPKVEMQERFSPNYKLPEKLSKYSRPVLDLELHPKHGPCVRCYLALPDRPREAHNDKDITQAEDHTVVLSNVNLMNFGDPLRAFTWVEDYIKNPEHVKLPRDKPIIRSFLVPLAEYQRTLNNNEMIIVDADRAPGQVKIPSGNYQLKTVPDSLVSFTDRVDVMPQDGTVLNLDVMSEMLFGEGLHPEVLAQGSSIAHQHGREIENRSERYQADLHPKAKDLIEARTLNSNLRGFGLQPSSAAIPSSSKYLDKFGVHAKASKKHKKTSAAAGSSQKKNNLIPK